jgi:carbon monoxide dehydrogenase subunit G
MISIELRKEIEAPAEVVFDLLADHTQFPIWDSHFIDASLTTERPIMKGSKGVTVGEIKGKRVENEIYYDAYERPRFVSGGTTSGAAIAKNSVEFIPTATGTLVDFRLQVKLKGFIRLLEPFIKSTIVKEKRETLDELEEYIIKHRRISGEVN